MRGPSPLGGVGANGLRDMGVSPSVASGVKGDDAGQDETDG